MDATTAAPEPGEPGHHPAIAPPGPPRAGLAHRVLRMAGRDPHEEGRASTPLELLFDLTFVVAVGQAASQLAHEVFVGHVGPAIIAFLFVAFAVSWAWINFSWFASAFDTDDWVFRVVTMVQMVGVCILASASRRCSRRSSPEDRSTTRSWCSAMS